MNAQKSLSSISANRDLWIAQYHQELHERDRISGLSAARREGLDEGIKQGMKQGIKQGVMQGQIALAKKFMARGHTAEEAAEFAEIDIKLLK